MRSGQIFHHPLFHTEKFCITVVMFSLSISTIYFYELAGSWLGFWAKFPLLACAVFGVGEFIYKGLIKCDCGQKYNEALFAKRSWINFALNAGFFWITFPACLWTITRAFHIPLQDNLFTAIAYLVVSLPFLILLATKRAKHFEERVCLVTKPSLCDNDLKSKPQKELSILQDLADNLAESSNSRIIARCL